MGPNNRVRIDHIQLLERSSTWILLFPEEQSDTAEIAPWHMTKSAGR